VKNVLKFKRRKSNDFLKGGTNHTQFLGFSQETKEKLENIRLIRKMF